MTKFFIQRRCGTSEKRGGVLKDQPFQIRQGEGEITRDREREWGYCWRAVGLRGGKRGFVLAGIVSAPYTKKENPQPSKKLQTQSLSRGDGVQGRGQHGLNKSLPRSHKQKKKGINLPWNTKERKSGFKKGKRGYKSKSRRSRECKQSGLGGVGLQVL